MTTGSHLYKSRLAYNEVVRRMLQILPYNVEVKQTSTDIATKIGCSEAAVNIIRPMLLAMGAVEMKHEGSKGGGGKHTLLKRVKYDAEVYKQLTDLGLPIDQGDQWSYSTVESVTQRCRLGQADTNKVNEQLTPVAAPTPPTHNTYPGPRGFEVLRPMLKDEPKALIEAARQYMERRAFLVEKAEEFKRHGLDLDLTPYRGTDDRFEHISLVLPYVTALERANEKLSKVTTGGGADRLKVETLEATIADLKKRIEQIRVERDTEKADHHRTVLARDKRIRELEEQVAAFRRNGNGNSTASTGIGNR
jgi:hypothetical protein